jgi:hypothetical protein
MHGSRFDALTRTLAMSSRRQVLRAATGGLVGGLCLPVHLPRGRTQAAAQLDLSCDGLCDMGVVAIRAGGQAACASMVTAQLCGPGAPFCAATAIAICTLVSLMPGSPCSSVCATGVSGSSGSISSTVTPAPPVSFEGCTAAPCNYGGVPATINVLAGELMVADFWIDGQPEQVGVLESGTWETKEAVMVGCTWRYPDCSREVVDAQAQIHAFLRKERGANSTGEVVGSEVGFSPAANSNAAPSPCLTDSCK